MKLFATILFAFNLAPSIKDTVAPSFNKYTMGVSLKVPENTCLKELE